MENTEIKTMTGKEINNKGQVFFQNNDFILASGSVYDGYKITGMHKNDLGRVIAQLRFGNDHLSNSIVWKIDITNMTFEITPSQYYLNGLK